MRINGAWTGLLTDWLDQNQLDAPGTRSRLARYAPDDSVPVAVWRELLEDTLDTIATGVAPELDVGACVQPRHVGVLGYLVLACETLGDAMLAYQRYERLFYGEQLAQIDTDGTDAEIRWPQTPEPLGQKADGVAIAALVTFLRRQLDDPPPPSGIAFHDVVSPEQASAYEAFFDCPVVFGDDFVRVRFPLHSLQMPMPRRDPTLRQLLNRQADALLQTLSRDQLLEEQLHRNLLRLLAEGDPTLERMARRLHMAPRTLQRRLARHGMSWQQWLDHAREQLARQYLADPGLNLNEIALLLGFSEQSAFTRSFQRWTGETPGGRRRVRDRRS
ncbi:AraC family transcriptional regulator [Halospina denitrificans]|uniref:AraC family transcriptional regulator n=1 Tax=Halospina denitrificans TaxID=332522 RepID=A0A4R7JQF0_9GAMM|nr:AraC family transcriptional regulator [Halospina denitrificans]TDT40360.1 AraC family transcriptional regulator [Halospina denitrificans]